MYRPENEFGKRLVITDSLLTINNTDNIWSCDMGGAISEGKESRSRIYKALNVSHRQCYMT